MNIEYLILMNVVSFVLLNFLPVTGAFLLAGKLASDSPPLKYALMILLYLIQCAANFSLLGIFGMLNIAGGIIASAISGVICCIIAGKNRPSTAPNIVPPESESYFYCTILQKLIWGMLLLLIWKSSMMPGTDTYLYHLYYPAMWITKGKIFAVTLPGLPHEYFPICGETIYGWLLLSGNTLFVPYLSCCAWAMCLLAMAALWRSYNIPSIYIISGIWLCISCGILFENSVLVYTDVLTGAFLTTGISLLILALNGKITERKKQFFLAALAGFALGFSAAIKYSGLVLAPIITLMLLICFFVRNPMARKGAWITAGCAFLAAGGYYIPNLIKTGNPFYPVKIPFIFPQGIDFKRESVPFSEIWTFFVNNNQWDMNRMNACLLIGLIGGTLILVIKKVVPENRETVKLCVWLLAVFLVAEFVMLLIYPAMAQARQIIPFVMALGMLFPPVLFGLFGKFLRSKRSFAVYTVLILGLGLLNFYKISIIISLSIFLGLVLFTLIQNKYHNFVRAVIILAVLTSIVFSSVIRFKQSLSFFRLYGGVIVSDIIKHLKQNCQKESVQRIASVGCWFNYMMMMDLSGNEVFYVPVNKKNTTHPHEVSSVSELRDDPVPYPVWKRRLYDAGCHYLVIDLSSHQDFLTNRDLELRWALEHPEDFELICCNEHISFFRIK